MKSSKISSSLSPIEFVCQIWRHSQNAFRRYHVHKANNVLCKVTVTLVFDLLPLKLNHFIDAQEWNRCVDGQPENIMATATDCCWRGGTTTEINIDLKKLTTLTKDIRLRKIEFDNYTCWTLWDDHDSDSVTLKVFYWFWLLWFCSNTHCLSQSSPLPRPAAWGCAAANQLCRSRRNQPIHISGLSTENRGTQAPKPTNTFFRTVSAESPILIQQFHSFRLNLKMFFVHYNK